MYSFLNLISFFSSFSFALIFLQVFAFIELISNQELVEFYHLFDWFLIIFYFFLLNLLTTQGCYSISFSIFPNCTVLNHENHQLLVNFLRITIQFISLLILINLLRAGKKSICFHYQILTLFAISYRQLQVFYYSLQMHPTPLFTLILLPLISYFSFLPVGLALINVIS